ncbi:MAG: hypothetical protein U0835_16915 [Isosphaeraceae bacterium]
MLADNSQSLLVRDGDASTATRGDWARSLLSKEAPWKARLGQDFDVRGYAFDPTSAPSAGSRPSRSTAPPRP